MIQDTEALPIQLPTIANELNNSLATIALRTELLSQQLPKDDAKQQDVAIIAAEIDRIASLISSLQQLSQNVESDITSRKQTEQQLRQAQIAIGQLAGGVAHDFNDLLTAINGYSELALRRMNAEDPLTKNLVKIQRAGNRAATLTQQLLVFSHQHIVGRLP